MWISDYQALPLNLVAIQQAWDYKTLNSSYENIAKVDGGGIFEDIASSIGRMGGLVQVQQSGDGRKTDAATSPTEWIWWWWWFGMAIMLNARNIMCHWKWDPSKHRHIFKSHKQHALNTISLESIHPIFWFVSSENWKWFCWASGHFRRLYILSIRLILRRHLRLVYLSLAKRRMKLNVFELYWSMMIIVIITGIILTIMINLTFRQKFSCESC